VYRPQVYDAELVLWSEEPMKSSPAARAAVINSGCVRLPSECTVWRWRSPRYHPGPVPGTDVGAGAGSNLGPGSPKRSVTVTCHSVPGGTIAYGPSTMLQTPGVIGPAR
jgi:hypothetical protein